MMILLCMKEKKNRYMHTFDIRTDFLGIDESKQTWDVDDF